MCVSRRSHSRIIIIISVVDLLYVVLIFFLLCVYHLFLCFVVFFFSLVFFFFLQEPDDLSGEIEVHEETCPSESSQAASLQMHWYTVHVRA